MMHFRRKQRTRHCYDQRVVTVQTWLVVDAVLDNVISVEIRSTGESEIERAQSLRKRGWELSAAHPLRGHGPVGWPPTDATLGIELEASDLAFVRTQVDAAIDTAARILASERIAPQSRAEQERSIAGLERACAELVQLNGA